MGIGGMQESNERQQLPSLAGRDSTRLTISQYQHYDSTSASFNTVHTGDSGMSGTPKYKVAFDSFGVEVVCHHVMHGKTRLSVSFFSE